LPPHKETIYCFENDSVQYLVERRNKIPADSDVDVKEEIRRNWKRSKESTADMIRYVCSLDPLPLDEIKTIYDVRCTISILSKLVLETLQCVAENVNNLESKKKEVEQMKAKIASGSAKFEQSYLRTVMSVDQKRVQHRKLDYLNVVCEGPKCVEFVDGEAIYQQICSRKCNSYYWSAMFVCEAMTWSQYCKHCHCERSKHKWSSIESKIVTEKVNLVQEKVDVGQAAENDATDNAVEIIDRAIWECEERVKSYRYETKQMLRSCAMLNAYVSQNVLVAPSGVDEMKVNLENRIKTYERAEMGKRLTDLRQIQSKYKTYLEEEESRHFISFEVHEYIEKVKQQLYGLELNGDDLKEAMEAEEATRVT